MFGLTGDDDVADVSLRGTAPGRVSPKVRATGNVAHNRDMTILLVHGYNVGEAKAVRDCTPFRDALAYFHPLLRRKTFICTWPGNLGTIGLRRASYPLMVGKAVRCGVTFGRYIRKEWSRDGAPPHLVVIAHSLACRLTLEMLEELASPTNPFDADNVDQWPAGLRRLTIILMAAAVPSDYLEVGNRLRAAIQTMPNRCDFRCAVMHSTDDKVLTWAFRPGQLAALENASEAVGRRGRPESVNWSMSRPMFGFDHGDYWKELETAERAARFLGVHVQASAMALPLSRRRALRERELPATALLPAHMAFA